MRKKPTQARAIERVNRMLDVMDAGILERGLANVTMNDVALGAEVPIGSVYQFFQNKEQIVESLCERHFDALRQLVAPHFQNVNSIADFTRDMRATLKMCWKYSLDNPSYNILTADPYAWTIVREADWQDSIINARHLTKVLKSFIRYIPDEQIMAFCTIICDSASNTVRLAWRFREMRNALFDQFAEMVESRIFGLLRENAVIERAIGEVRQAEAES